MTIRVCGAASATCLLLLAWSAPASAQSDLSGNWGPLYHEDQPERIPGPDVGDYLGLPINDEARMRGDSWMATLLTLPEHQCKPHPSAYGYRGPANLRITTEVDPQTQRVLKISTHIQWMEQHREIWMDGRPHPPEYAAHTWQGFSTGQWVGDALVVTTTHLKAGWVRRNGIPYSDRARFTERWARRGNILTHFAILEDPVYLTEPFVRTTNWTWAPNQQIDPYPCGIVQEIPDQEKGAVPHFLPGMNTVVDEFADKHGLAHDAARGGAQTAYPEYMKTYKAPPPTAKPAARPAAP